FRYVVPFPDFETDATLPVTTASSPACLPASVSEYFCCAMQSGESDVQSANASAPPRRERERVFTGAERVAASVRGQGQTLAAAAQHLTSPRASAPMRALMKLLLTLTALVFASVPLRAEQPFPDDLKINGFAVGCQAYSFNRFTVF